MTRHHHHYYGVIMMASLLLVCITMIHAESSIESVTTPERDFLQWLADGTARVDGITIATSPSGKGRGLVATQALPKGHVFGRIPLTMLINIEHAVVSDMGPYLDELSDTNAIAVFMAYERNRADSKWAPYLRALPQHFTTPMWWTTEQLDTLQQSSVRGFAKRRKDTAYVAYQSFAPEITAVVKYDDFLWGLSLIWSRNFGVAIRDKEGNWQKAPCFVPLADMLNTGTPQELSADCKTNDASTHFECFTTKDVKAGGELLGPYSSSKRGDYANGQLLMDYGFVLPVNPNDVVMLTLPTLTRDHTDTDEVYDIKRSLLQQMQRLDNSMFHVRAPAQNVDISLPVDIMGYMRVLNLNAAVIERIGDRQKIFAALRNNEAFTIQHERTTAAALSEEIRKLKQLYPTSTEDDEESLKLITPCADVTDDECARRVTIAQSALQLRISEKKILTKLYGVLHRYFYQLTLPIDDTAGQPKDDGRFQRRSGKKKAKKDGKESPKSDQTKPAAAAANGARQRVNLEL